jgi:hypothetical protein
VERLGFHGSFSMTYASLLLPVYRKTCTSTKNAPVQDYAVNLPLFQGYVFCSRDILCFHPATIRDDMVLRGSSSYANGPRWKHNRFGELGAHPRRGTRHQWTLSLFETAHVRN